MWHCIPEIGLNITITVRTSNPTRRTNFLGIPYSIISLLLKFNYLTPSVKVLLDNLIVIQLVNKLPTLYGTLTFITIFKKSCHKSFSWSKWIQSRLPSLISSRSVLILFSHLPSGLLSSALPIKFLYPFLSYISFMLHLCPSHPPCFGCSKNIW
jgi:hypothetical protein